MGIRTRRFSSRANTRGGGGGERRRLREKEKAIRGTSVRASTRRVVRRRGFHGDVRQVHPRSVDLDRPGGLYPSCRDASGPAVNPNPSRLGEE